MNKNKAVKTWESGDKSLYNNLDRRWKSLYSSTLRLLFPCEDMDTELSGLHCVPDSLSGGKSPSSPIIESRLSNLLAPFLVTTLSELLWPTECLVWRKDFFYSIANLLCSYSQQDLNRSLWNSNLKVLYFFKSSHYLHTGSPNFFEEEATPVIVSCFVGGTWNKETYTFHL
jgi:hypothetical protein